MVSSTCRITAGTKGTSGRHPSRPQPRTRRSDGKNGDSSHATVA